MTHLYERFQAWCKWCFKVHERDTGEAAILAAMEHERTCTKRKEAK